MKDESVLDNFSLLVSSLKLAQRAELFDEGHDKNLIEKLYVDPLPNNGVFKQMIQDNTVFLVGRKGTGKSTIFARVQEYYRNSKTEISAYVDVKTLYGKLAQEIKLDQNDNLRERIMLFEGFLMAVITDLIRELLKNLEQKNVLLKLWKKREYQTLIKKLEEIKSDIQDPDFREADIIKNLKRSQKVTASKEGESTLKSNAKISKSSELNIEGSLREKINGSAEEHDEFSGILIRNFNLTEFITCITEALESVGIRKLHILLDDFSEIDYEAQQIFVNYLLAPLNNWSNKFIRFKVAAYPKRIFYGDIDKGKIDEIYLDYYELYKVKDLPDLEKKAKEFLDRLLKTRFEYYLEQSFDDFFQIDTENSWDDYLETLFHASMNIPRILGHILHYCYQSAIIYGKKITKVLIEQAAQKYYRNQIKYYFEKTNFLKEAFDEKLDRYSQQVLVNLLIERAKNLKAELGTDSTELFRALPKGRIPTSHFYINKEYEKFLHSLELNYFVSKYYEQADRDGVTISIYSLNFGLCQEQNINFGRPKGDTKYRKYYISRHFNYDKLLQHYLLEQKQFVCKKCGHTYLYSDHEILQKIGMMCYLGCKESESVGEVYKFKDEKLFDGIRKENLLPEIELDILHVLSQDKKARLFASLIARELDCSHQLITRRSEKLENMELIEKDNETIEGKQRKIYRLTEKAERLYFSE
ncbi:hypothetical protein [Brevibacillus fortis]|uniref:Uncharacterized protein n=1 Tax=Brevibacillus fortis TaxID=2126352 RepID=A0A2P7UT44_9BACL|nr:hypothetical protein [Brevibacillus fortis]PSJ90170.1 hypothetical protein C7R93_22605 [Brevibacillus fortis]